ncbi:hypothetical protein [Lentzea sp. NPDC060358]
MDDKSLDTGAIQSYLADTTEATGRMSALQEVPAELLREVGGALGEAIN